MATLSEQAENTSLEFSVKELLERIFDLEEEEAKNTISVLTKVVAKNFPQQAKLFRTLKRKILQEKRKKMENKEKYGIEFISDREIHTKFEDGSSEVNSDLLVKEMEKVIPQIQVLSKEFPFEELFESDRKYLHQMLSGFVNFVTAEDGSRDIRNWYDAAQLHMSKTILADMGCQNTLKGFSDYKRPPKGVLLYISHLFQNGNDEEKAAAAGLIPILAIILIEDCFQDYWSNTFNIGINEFHHAYGRARRELGLPKLEDLYPEIGGGK